MRYTAVGSVVLSPDFLVGVPVGFIVATPVLFSSTVQSNLPTLLLAVAGFGAAIGAIVLTALSVLLTTTTPAYRRLLAKTPHGVGGVTRPFQLVIGISATAVVAGFGTALLVEVLPAGWAKYLVTGVAIALLLWSVFGCYQVSRQMITHWTNGARIQDIEDAKNMGDTNEPAAGPNSQ